VVDSEFSTTADFLNEHREIVTRDGVVATIHRPSSQSNGRVLIVPGWSGTRAGPADLLVFLASRLTSAGWTAVRMDIPGRGDAEGQFAHTGLDEMIAAACSATDEPAHMIGLCSGGNVSLGATTSSKSQELRAKSLSVIALSTLPFQPARSKDFDRRRRWKNLKQYASKAFSPNTWARLMKGEINVDRVKKNVTTSEKTSGGERNLKDSARDIEKELLDWKGPALFIWGSGDEEAAPARAHFEKLHTAGMGSPEATHFHTIDGANHNFYSRAWREELSAKIIEFLNKNAAR